MGAGQTRASWSVESDLTSLVKKSNGRDNGDLILLLGHSDQEKVSKPFKLPFRLAERPSNCKCIKYAQIHNVSDEFYLRQLFPDKVWQNVLESSRNSDDLENLSDASPFFRNILMPRRKEFLFPKVFEVLVCQYEQNPSECFDMLKYQELEQPKHRPEYLRASDILWVFPGNYRLVCRAWNNAVQDYYGKLKHWQMKLKTDRKVRRRRIPMNHMIDTTSHSWFTKNFHGRNGNPFLHKSLSIADICSDMEISGLQQVYKRETHAVIRKYGHHLNYIQISMTIQTSDVSGVSQLLQYLFKNKETYMLPNIKVLKLEYNFDENNNMPIQLQDKLARFENQNYLTFPNLRFLSVKNLPPSIVNELLKQNRSTICQLEIESWMCPDEYNYHLIKLTNLRNLSVDIYSESGIRKLEQYGSTWELTKFHCVRRGLNYIKLSRILRMVCNNWSATLKDFYLELQNIDAEEEMWELSKSFELHFPELERLSIKLSTDCCCLDFLLPLKKLKYIEIESGVDKPWQKYRKEHRMGMLSKNQKVKFIGYEKTMLKSNVWKLFPKLECIAVQGNLYDRKIK